ncbi:PTS sugar transporter subunit IIA [Streptomyces sp. NPDC047453]|uniref:PTS sugar transporter subunit IIA n=1 Tax=Streptomyces sp. NPDC047453 TaxID=3154812 RepID=UPI0033C6CC6F
MISTVPLSGRDAPVVVVNVFTIWKDIESVRAAITRTTLESVLEREALSSTAFTDGFAVPHARAAAGLTS